MTNKSRLMTEAAMLNVSMMNCGYTESDDSKELADIVINHAAAAGVAAMASGILPGVGALVASGIAIGAIWSMYIRIAAFLKLKLRKDFLKVIASAVLSNIVTGLAGMLVLELAVSFIPGAGILAFGVVNFGATYMAGVIYLKALKNIFAAGRHPDEMTDSQIKAEVTAASKDVDAKAVFCEAKRTFTEMKADGSLNENGKRVTMER